MDISRRQFLERAGLIGLGATSLALLASACSSDSEESLDTGKLAVLRVSSDLYTTDKKQRLAFAIFEGSTIASVRQASVTLRSPSGQTQRYKDVQIRNKSIPKQGIFSVNALLNEPGAWQLYTSAGGKEIDLAFTVAEQSTAPGLGDDIPTVATPTTHAPLDASLLCTRFEGNCEFHDHSVPELLATSKPFIVLFATPARCQSAYCGPVLELTRSVAKDYDIDVAHIEIYKDETSPEFLDAVLGWKLPSEPWLFAVDGQGVVKARLDGAFDQSEIDESFALISS